MLIGKLIKKFWWEQTLTGTVVSVSLSTVPRRGWVSDRPSDPQRFYVIFCLLAVD